MLPLVVGAALGEGCVCGGVTNGASPANGLEHMAECVVAKRYPMMSHDVAQEGGTILKKLNTNGLSHF